ncbi:hypothetical protein [Pseudoalteromonas spongiae]
MRNGVSHSAKRAAEHLTLKYNNGKSYAQKANPLLKISQLKARGRVLPIR